MSSENLNEILRKTFLKVWWFFFTKFQAKTLNVSENAFCIYDFVKISRKMNQIRKNFWNSYVVEQVWEAASEGTILRSGLRLKAPYGHV